MLDMLFVLGLLLFAWVVCLGVAKLYFFAESVRGHQRLIREMGHTLNRIEQQLKSVFAARAVEFYTWVNGQKVKLGGSMFLEAGKRLPLSIEPKDANGNAARVDGAPVWALSNEALGSLDVDAAGMSAIFTPSGMVGVTTIQVKADADLGEGVEEIFGTLDVEVLSGKAVSISITAGEPI